ncbi:hypothetical protein MTR67_044558 [Solanum verrucosum]|uniref:RING-type E3 ubiquitin transferase n=1 Tax=Solanum verrucosum TaxID=315347 RepID=A0AAF0UQR4_SOLVR|nr:hypothetical protein MTR67_044558 [Solanum verrucosum]
MPKDGVNNPTKTEEICVICHTKYELEETIGTLRCGHEYHAGCIKQWLRKKDCPCAELQFCPSRQQDNYRNALHLEIILFISSIVLILNFLSSYILQE